MSAIYYYDRIIFRLHRLLESNSTEGGPLMRDDTSQRACGLVVQGAIVRMTTVLLERMSAGANEASGNLTLQAKIQHKIRHPGELVRVLRRDYF